MEATVGVRGDALEWCRSYFSDRTQSVCICGVPSVPRPLTSGMPQGSVVGPYGFPTYTTPVGKICCRHGINYHMYADDSQLYVAFDLQDEHEARGRMEACISEIKEWMLLNHLKVNDSKTEFLIIGSQHQLRQLSSDSIKIGNTTIKASQSARNIGAIFDSGMSMKEHINTICRACYLLIRNIGKVRSVLTKDAAISLVHAFVSSKLDHLNALIYGVPKYQIQRLQRIQNNCARIILKAKRRDHITPLLKGLHWLPIDSRIQFKVLLTTFKALKGLAPGYIRDLVEPYQPRRALRSMDLSFLRRPRSRTKTFGDRSFAYCAPHLWNRLPRSVRFEEDIDNFKSVLKSHLFKMAY
jgi:hypothetical protein